MAQEQGFMDFSEEVSSYELADTGTYELTIDNAELKKTDNGINFIALTIAVRNDVDQLFSGAKIWENIWENEVYRDPAQNGKRIKKDVYNAMSADKKQTINVSKEYDDFKIRTLVHAQDVDKTIKGTDGREQPNPNFKTSFKNIEEVVLFLNGMNFQAKVNKYLDEKSGKEKNSIDYKTIKRTTVSPVSAADDEELPF